MDAFDTKTRQPLWHGQATDTFDPKKIDPVKLEKAVSDVMSRFPQRPPGT